MGYGKRKRAVAGAVAAYGMFKRSFGAKRAAPKHVAKRPRLAKRTRVGVRLKRRGGGSRTATTLKQADPAGQAHSAISTKTIRVGKWKKCSADTIGKWQYQQTYRYNLTSSAGQQGVSTVLVPLHLQKILNSTGAGYNSYQSYTALELLNPYLSPTQLAGFNNYGNVQIPQNDRFVCESVCIQMELSNFSIVSAYVDIYVLQCRKSTADDATTIWSRGLLLQALGQPAMSQPVAVTVAPQGTGVEGYPIPSAVHVKPTDGKLFAQFYKTHKVKSLMMMGGASETVNIDIGVNKVIDVTTLKQLGSQNTQYIAGLTWQIMIVQRGTLVEDTGVTSAQQFPTYGTTKIGCILQEKYKLCGVKGNTTRLNTSTEYSNIPYGQASGNQSLINVIDQVEAVSAGLAGI